MPTTKLTIADAKATRLMGQTGVWHGNGGRALALVPDGVLRQARSFFKQRHAEDPSDRLREQIDAITLVLDDREANSPQARLAL
jgi:hypothetical protein